MSASKATKARICAAVLVMAATAGCRDSQNATGPEGAATATQQTTAALPVRPGARPAARTDPVGSSSEDVGQAQQQLSELLDAELRAEFGCVVATFEQQVPLLTLVRPGAGRRAQRVIDAYSARYSGPTSRLTQRVRLNAQQKLKQTRIDLAVYRPSKQIIVRPKTRDDQRSCPYLIVTTNRRDGADPTVRRWLAKVRQNYPAGLISIRVGQIGTPG